MILETAQILGKKQKILGSMPTMLRNLRVQHLLIGSDRKKVYWYILGLWV